MLTAYSTGIFPWYNPGEEILWWSPNPRCVIFPDQVQVSRSMKKFIKKTDFKVTYDTAFEKVINLCGSTRKETWITDAIKKSYKDLFDIGLAHSVETWRGDELVGGLYGMSLGKIFFGESMFSTESNASKLAFIKLAEKLKDSDFKVIDCQIQNPYLESLGAVEISRLEFLSILNESLQYKTIVGNWSL